MEKMVPESRCTRCGKASSVLGNRDCFEVIDGKRCKGAYKNWPSPNDWCECPVCKKTGFHEGHACYRCKGDGWIFIAKRG